MHFEEYAVHALVEKTPAIDHVHPSSVEIDLDIGLRRNSGWMSAPLFACWILGIDEAAD